MQGLPTVKLNEAQQQALIVLFSNKEQDEFPEEPMEFAIKRGQLLVNGVYLHKDGEFATYPEGSAA